MNENTTRFLQQVILALCVIIFVLLSAHRAYLGITELEGPLGNQIAGLLYLGFAYALLEQYRWALWLLRAVCIISVFLLPLGLIGLIFAGEYLNVGANFPAMHKILIVIIPLEAFALCGALLINPKTMSHGQVSIDT